MTHLKISLLLRPVDNLGSFGGFQTNISFVFCIGMEKNEKGYFFVERKKSKEKGERAKGAKEAQGKKLKAQRWLNLKLFILKLHACFAPFVLFPCPFTHL